MAGDRFRRPLGQRIIGAIARMNFWYLLTHKDSRLLRAGFAFINGGISIGLITALAMLVNFGLLFPPLAPTAFLFFYAPATIPAAPRSAILGHVSGLAAGWLSVLIVGSIADLPADTSLTSARLAAVALSMSLTCAAMILLSAPHPPAAGTALIVSMGTMTHWDQSAALIGGLFLLAGQALLINRLAGLRFPIWAPYASDGRTMVAHAVEPGEAVPTITLYGNAASDLGLPGSSARAEAEGPPARNGS